MLIFQLLILFRISIFIYFSALAIRQLHNPVVLIISYLKCPSLFAYRIFFSLSFVLFNVFQLMDIANSSGALRLTVLFLHELAY